MDPASLSNGGEGDLSALFADLERLAAGSKSVFPGRVLLNRKKSYALIDDLTNSLVKHAEGSPSDFDACYRALEALVGVHKLASRVGFGSRSIWSVWFADVNRKKLSSAIGELRSALEPVIAAQASPSSR